jgi:hypothetical protein
VLSGSQRNAIVSHTRTHVCYVLDSWLRHYASDFLAESELFADSPVGGSAPTFADSLAVWYRVSPGKKALPFHRKRPAYEAPTKIMLKYCGDELDPKSRTLLDYHPVEVAAEWRWWRRADFVLVRPSELMSPAWMKDAANAHARDCPNIKRFVKPVQPHQPLGGVGNSARHRRRGNAPQHAQALHRAGALLPRRANLHAHVRRLRRPQPVGRAAAQGPLREAVDQVGEAISRARPALQSQVELGRRCALLRCEHEVGVAGV